MIAHVSSGKFIAYESTYVCVHVGSCVPPRSIVAVVCLIHCCEENQHKFSKDTCTDFVA